MQRLVLNSPQAVWQRHLSVRAAVRSSLLRNSVYMMATTVATSGLGYLYWIVAARLLNPGAVGLAAGAVSMMLLAATLGNLGMYSALVQLLPRAGTQREKSAILTVALAWGAVAGLVSGLIAAIVLAAIAPKFHPLVGDGVYLAAFVGGVVFTILAMLLDYAWVAEREAGKMLVWNAVFAVVKLPLVAVPLFAGAGAKGIVLTWGLSQALAFGGELAQLMIVKGYRIDFGGWLARTRSLLRRFLSHHVTNLGAMAPVFILPIVVAARLSAAEAAYFYAAWRIGGFFFVFASSAASSLYAEGAHDAAKLIAQARHSLALSLGALLITLLAVVVAGRLVLSAFGAGYEQNAYACLVLLVVAAMPDAIVATYKTILRVRDRLMAAAALSWITGLLAVALSAILVDIDGLAGVAWAWILAMTAGSVFAVVDALWTRRRRLGMEQ